MTKTELLERMRAIRAEIAEISPDIDYAHLVAALAEVEGHMTELIIETAASPLEVVFHL